MPTWSGFWNYVYDDGRTALGRDGYRRRFRIALKNSRNPYNRVLAALIQNVGSAVGTQVRVGVQDINDFTSLGGKRPTELRTVINRPITRGAVPGTDEGNARDELYNQKWYPQNPAGKVWPVDKAGIGSGGLAGTKGI
jgi:hypothetical protein